MTKFHSNSYCKRWIFLLQPIDFSEMLCYNKSTRIKIDIYIIGGVHMAVKVGSIYNRLERNNDMDSKDFLQVNCCGIYEQTAENAVTVRPLGRKDYQLIIIAKGGAVFLHNGKEIILSGGEMILIPPFERNEYRYTDYVDAMWIHFTGTAAEKIVRQYDIEPFCKYRISDTTHFFVYAEKIIKEFQLQKVGFMNNCNGYLLNMLTLVKRRIDAQFFAENHRAVPDLTLAIDEMQTDFSKNTNISGYAEMFNISVSYFIHLFTQQFGVSPYQYLLNIRMSQAKYLLTETNMPINDIADNIGYDDPFYFSRIFKKHIGVSPSAYRKKFQLDIIEKNDADCGI